MSTGTYILTAAMTALLAAVVCAQKSHGLPDPPKPENCMLTLKTTRGESPWQGMTESYEQEQAGKHVKAAALDKKVHAPMPSLARFDEPDVLLGRSEKLKTVVVNKRWFSDIRRGDATRLGMGQKHPLGVFRDRAFKRLKPRDLILFLLQSQLIETYWHLEAELCMYREEDRPGSYRARFRGVHKYCTNSCEEKSFAFVVGIDKKTGAMALTGGDLFEAR